MHGHHAHGHSNKATSRKGRAFALGIILNVGFVVVEVIYGLAANSTALLADAGHNAGDVIGLVLAWMAMGLAEIKPKGKYTYGLRKTTILVSILNALLLFVAVYIIGKEAVAKFAEPEPIAGNMIIIVAGIGVLINTITALLFIKGQKEDLNVKGAFLHMAADAGVSLGVVIAGFLINLTGLLWIDPVMSLIIVVVIIIGTWRLLTDSIGLALDAVPKNIDVDKVRQFLLSMDGVQDIHDLHIWAMSTTENALTAHLIRPEGHSDEFIMKVQQKLSDKFGIGHTTFQIEKSSFDDDCKGG